MLFAVSNLVHESVVLTTRDMRSFVIYTFNQTENYFVNICSSSFDDYVLDLTVSEISENASSFLAVIVTNISFHVVSGNTSGSILFEKNIPHRIKNLDNIKSMYIPLHRKIVCFYEGAICLFNPYDEDISVVQTELKLDISKRLKYLPIQQDQCRIEDIMVSSNNGPNIFILMKSLISGCYSLQCCEVTDSGDVLVWWDADISSFYVSIARTTVYDAEDAVLLASGKEVRVYTVDGLLFRLSVDAALGLSSERGDCYVGGDTITAVQGVNASADSVVHYSPLYIDKLHFLVATFQSGLFLCSVQLPVDDASLVVPMEINSVSTRHLHVSYDSFSFFSPTFSSQIVADETNVFDRHHSFLPYFDNISILGLGVNLAVGSPDEPYEKCHLLTSNSSFGVQMLRVSLSPFGEGVEMGGKGITESKPPCLGISCFMFGVLDALWQVDKILPLTNTSDAGDSVPSLHYVTDPRYPLTPSDHVSVPEGSLSPFQYSSMLYRVEHGTPLLSESGNMYPLEITALAQPLSIFSVICDIPLDIIPITQRSYSNNWSTLVIMSSASLSESSLFSINHAGKFQAVMEKTDVIRTEPTLSFFRIRRYLVIQVTKFTINLLQLKNCRHPSPNSSTIFPVSSLSFPAGSSIEHVAFQSGSALWTKENKANRHATSNVFDKRKQYNASIFAVTCRNKLVVIQLVESKSKQEKSSVREEQEFPCTMKEVFSHTMCSDIRALSLSENSEEANGDKKLTLAVSHWDSRRSIQVLSLLLSNGSCCILSIVNSTDLMRTPPLRDMHAGNEGSGATPFHCVHVCPILIAHTDSTGTTQERCYIVGGCVDGHLVIFEYVYLNDSCVWKEVHQWSSFVEGGIQGISLLNFYDKEQYSFERFATSVSDSRRRRKEKEEIYDGRSKPDSLILYASAFIVNGQDSDFVYKLKLSTDTKKGSRRICSDIQCTRFLRQSSYRSHICGVHPLYISRSLHSLSHAQNESGQTTTDNEHVYVDNFLWVVSTVEANLTAGQTVHDHLSLCIGSKSIYEQDKLAPVTVATQCRRVPFHVLNMIYLNNPGFVGGCSTAGADKACVLIMYSYQHPSQILSKCPNIRTGVQIVDCNTLSTIWEYSPEISSVQQQSTVQDQVVAISLAPLARHAPHQLLFSFLILHSYISADTGSCSLAADKRSVMCSVYGGVDGSDEEAPGISLLHTLQLTKTFLQNDYILPFVVQPVGQENVIIASEQGVVVLGWRSEENAAAILCSLVEVAEATYSLSEKDRAVVSDVSVHRHFESAVHLPVPAANSDLVVATKPGASSINSKKMLQLSPALFSSSALSFAIYVALANVGIDIFEFSCQNNKLERKGFIGAEGMLLTDVLHSVSRSVDRTTEAAAEASKREGALEVKITGTGDSSSLNNEEENKFKGSVLCVDRNSGNVYLYDSRHRWIKQQKQEGQGQRAAHAGAEGGETAPPVLLSPYHPNLFTNQVKTSYVAYKSLVVSEFSVRDAMGLKHNYQVAN